MSHETFMGRRPRKPGFEVTVTTLAPIKGLEIEEDDGEDPKKDIDLPAFKHDVTEG